MPTHPYSGPLQGAPPVILPGPDSLTATVYPYAYFGSSGDDGATITTALVTYNVVYLAPLAYTINSSVSVGTGQVVYQQPGTTFGGSNVFNGGTILNASTVGTDLYRARSGALGATLNRSQVTVATASLTTSGTVYLTAIALPAGTTISNIAALTGTGTLKTGGTHGWYIICTSDRKVRAATADQTDASTVWGVASTEYPLAIATAGGASATTYTTPYTGLYYIGMMVANSTGSQPNLCAGPTMVTGIGLAPILCGASATTSATTPPATDGSVTIGAITFDATKNFYFWLT